MERDEFRLLMICAQNAFGFNIAINIENEIKGDIEAMEGDFDDYESDVD